MFGGSALPKLNFREAIRKMKEKNKKTIGRLPSVYLKITTLIETNIKLAKGEGISKAKIGWVSNNWFYVWRAVRLGKDDYGLVGGLNPKKRLELINKLGEYCKQKGLNFWATFRPPADFWGPGKVSFWVGWDNKKKRKNFGIKVLERKENEYYNRKNKISDAAFRSMEIHAQNPFPTNPNDEHCFWSDDFGWVSSHEFPDLYRAKGH